MQKKDSIFKNLLFSIPENWNINSNGSIVGKEQYKPDISIKNSDGKIVCILESTSTGDRKVGLGEMLQADKLFYDEEINGILIFSLSGVSSSSPTLITQSKYINPYFKYLKNINKKYGLKKIYFISESDFKSINWCLLSEDFKLKSIVLIND